MQVHEVDYIMIGDTQFMRTELAADEEDRLREHLAELEGVIYRMRTELVADEEDRLREHLAELEGVIYRNCDPASATDSDAEIIMKVATETWRQGGG